MIDYILANPPAMLTAAVLALVILAIGFGLGYVAAQFDIRSYRKHTCVIKDPHFLPVDDINQHHRASHDCKRRRWMRVQQTLRRMQ